MEPFIAQIQREECTINATRNNITHILLN